MEPTPEQTAFMAKNWRDLIRPRLLEIEERSETYGKFSCEPLERGFGTTLGNTLRRVLLSSLQGAAITHDQHRGRAARVHRRCPASSRTSPTSSSTSRRRCSRSRSTRPTPCASTSTAKAPVTAGDITLVDGITVLNPDHHIVHAGEGRQDRDGADGADRPRLRAGRAPLAPACRSAPSPSTRSSRRSRRSTSRSPTPASASRPTTTS